MQNIKHFFEKAGLSIEVDNEPLFRRGNADIFQMSIFKREKATQTRKKGEYFRLYCGSKDNRVLALDADPKHQQVLLMVQEPKRVFFTKEYDRKTHSWREVSHVTPEEKRKFLVGMDECHLFMTQVPSFGSVNKVKEAHAALKPKAIAELEVQKGQKKPLRQGEWFFVKVSPKEQELIDLYKNSIQRKVRIDRSTRAGKPHVPDFIIRIKDVEYALGTVRHADHHPLELHGWHRIYRNTEIRQEVRNSFGGWID